MSVSRIIAIVLAVICLALSAIYIVSPETIGGPMTQGSLQSQQGYGLNMPGGKIDLQFTTIPLGVGSLTVPQWSAVVIFAVLGGMFLLMGFGTPQGKAGAR